MTGLSKNIRTHLVLLRDGWEINITEQQYNTLRLKKEDAKRNDMITITDADTQKVLFDGEMWEIKWFRKREIDPTLASTKYVCGYGIRHALNEDCKCKERFKCFDYSFQDWLTDRGFVFYYPEQITFQMQQQFLSYISTNGIKWYSKKNIDYAPRQ